MASVDGNARLRKQIPRNRPIVHRRFAHRKIKTTNNVGISAMKLYFTQTDRLKVKPRSAALRRGEVPLSKNLSRTKRSNTNNGTVIESGPRVAAWIIRTGKNSKNRQKAE